MKLLKTLAGIGLVFLFMTVFSLGVAVAHTGSPTPTVWSSGNTLTATNLNDTIAHMHNTFSGGIVDAHISSSAAIAHSKLATPALVPKAMAVVTANCDGTAAAGTACTFTGSKVTAVGANAAAGTYCVQLAYTPTNANYVVEVTSHTLNATCIVLGADRANAACGTITTRHFLVKCYDWSAAGGTLLNNDQFSITVLDDD